MMDAGVGAIVVIEDFARIVGIVTERDILRAVAARARAAEARVRHWMTESVVTIEPDTTVEEAAHQPNEYCLLPNLMGDAVVMAHLMLAET